MIIAIPRYGGRISPRFGFTQDILVVVMGRDGIESREVILMDRPCPKEIPDILAKKGVQIVLTGGINWGFQNLFRARGIGVIWGLIGTPEEALEAFLEGKIVSGMGRCPVGRRRHRHRSGPSFV